MVNTRADRKSQKLTDITPDRSKIEDSGAPDDRVNELVKTRQAGPNHVVARPRIPCLKVPREWDDRQDESDEGKYWEYWKVYCHRFAECES